MRILLALLMVAFSASAALANELNEIQFKQADDNKPITLNLWKGKPLLAAFWRSDCAPCLKEMKVLPNIATQNADLDIALVSLQDTAHARANLPALPDNVHVLVTDGDGKTVLSAFGNDRTMALPYSVMLSAKGSICAKHYGILSPDKVKEWRKQC